MKPIIQSICFIKPYTLFFFFLFFSNKGELFKLIKGDNLREHCDVAVHFNYPAV